MKPLSFSLLPILLIATLGVSPMVTVPAVADDDSSEVHKLLWPRTYQDDTTTVLVYQPDIEKWDGNVFQARAAVSVQDKGDPAPTFGVIWLSAQADVDKNMGIVTLSNIQVTKSNFPTEPTKAAAYLAFIQKHIPANAVRLPLSQIDNSYLLNNSLKKAAVQPVKNTPPQIIFSKTPALLILVDGAPVMRPVADTDYQRVFNTQAVIVQKNGGGAYYLRALKYWFKADNLTGPWKESTNTPIGAVSAAKAAIATKQVNPIDPAEGQDRPASPPTIYLSTGPAELVQTSGDPAFLPIPTTNLLEVKNSDNAIILDIDTQLYYVLISGRWFTSKSMDGPWAYISGDDLPSDFAKIPPDSSKANVLVSVPNTPQAQEAVIANSIPQTATVQRDKAKVTVQYDGAPQFVPIPDTSLQYAVNTALPVIEVNPSSFYCVANGVWFTAQAPTGPWAVATSVPPAIYSIPVESPIHYVTYVRVYSSTPEVVYVGYTPGYYGTVVSPDGVVVYGTGYSYPPYVGTTVYVPPPATYGYGAGFADGAVTGFAFGFAAGAVLGACLEPHYGCWGWGGGWGWHGGGNTVNVNINNGNVYNHWGNNTVVSHNTSWNNNHFSNNSAHGFNPYNGNWARTHNSSSWNSHTGTATHSDGWASGNTHTGNWNAHENNSWANANGAHGQSHTAAGGNAYTGNHGSITTRSGETANGAKAGGVTTDHNGNVNHTGGAYNPNTGKGVAYHNGNVYSNKDGNVYRHSENGGWQQHSSQGWQHSNGNHDVERQSQGWQHGNDRYSHGNGGRWGGSSSHSEDRGGERSRGGGEHSHGGGGRGRR